MKRIAVTVTMMGAILLVFAVSSRGPLEAPQPAEAVENTVVLMLGNGGDGTIGPVAPNTASEATMSIPAFCTDCYITRIEPDMVYWNDPNPLLTNGTPANYNADGGQGIWLHHDAVLTNAPCLANVFLSGNERTIYQAPAGYGSYIPVPGSAEDPNFCNSSWILNWHIHNSSPTATHKVKVKFTVTYRTGETVTRLKGVGLNIATAMNAEYTIPVGYSDTHTGDPNPQIRADYVITAAQQGQIIAMGGHVHDYGYGVSAFNMTRGVWLCTSTAGYGATSRYLPTMGPGTTGHPAAANAQALNHSYHQPSSPDNAYHIQNMALCSVTPSGSILCAGDVIRVHASYNNTSGFPVPDAMGIMSAALPATPPDADSDGTWDGCDDSDTDQFSDLLELTAGTQINDGCPDNPIDNAWPLDINNDTTSDISDISFLTGDFGLSVPPEEARHNIAPDPPDGFIDITDISRMLANFGDSCTP